MKHSTQHWFNIRSTSIPATFVRLGDIFLNGTDAIEASIDETIVHPEYERSRKQHDILLFRLTENQNFNDYVRPACLADSFNLTETRVEALGWGATSWKGRDSTVLQKVNLQLFDQSSCAALYSSRVTIANETQICAASPRNVSGDTCSVR